MRDYCNQESLSGPLCPVNRQQLAEIMQKSPEPSLSNVLRFSGTFNPKPSVRVLHSQRKWKEDASTRPYFKCSEFVAIPMRVRSQGVVPCQKAYHRPHPVPSGQQSNLLSHPGSGPTINTCDGLKSTNSLHLQQCSSHAFHFIYALTYCLIIPMISSGPIGSFSAPYLANSSANSNMFQFKKRLLYSCMSASSASGISESTVRLSWEP